jgi:hypothetical protein
MPLEKNRGMTVTQPPWALSRSASARNPNAASIVTEESAICEVGSRKKGFAQVRLGRR